ncbi:pyridoxal phosphate-dependent aminotransferase [Flavobacterium hercynium]|uniref:Aminotransferase n=1 Tax=Flavobacterium hercynium TaxID=387094 RepID=A0A226HH36_9FLAO|nr:aminotransferase class I/II-fold pyridoxal phosphate-dependent enzyme [Flavobacterium hercynium]OXA93178.1 hypothetical protein B0A66_07865 [Flavobacterium hercynium]SMP32862.1 LL-diaminopimelate aminotransferase/alanine-synthesizing transaminase [Flavobacterium hercynium]
MKKILDQSLLAEEKDAFAILNTLTTTYTNLERNNPNIPSLINLSIGNPDVIPNEYWLKRLAYHVQNPELHGYGKFNTAINDTLKSKFAAYHYRRFQKNNDRQILNYKEEVLDLLGSKEGIFYTLFSVLSPGDKILIPNPSYSVYHSVAKLVQAEVVPVDLKDNGNPDLESIAREDVLAGKILVLCSPDNPTTHLLTEDYLKYVIDFCKKNAILVILDLAYAQIAFDSTNLPCSILALKGGSDVAVELHSLSKSCSLAGWRIGFIAGNKKVLAKIDKIKSQIDFGMFLPIQKVAIELLDNIEKESTRQKEVYDKRLSFWIFSMSKIGWKISKPKAGFFLWCKLPESFPIDDDIEFVEKMLLATGVLVTPGSGFGSGGSGYIRIALVQDLTQLEIACHRIKKWLDKF